MPQNQTEAKLRVARHQVEVSGVFVRKRLAESAGHTAHETITQNGPLVLSVTRIEFVYKRQAKPALQARARDPNSTMATQTRCVYFINSLSALYFVCV